MLFQMCPQFPVRVIKGNNDQQINKKGIRGIEKRRKRKKENDLWEELCNFLGEAQTKADISTSVNSSHATHGFEVVWTGFTAENFDRMHDQGPTYFVR